MSAVRTTRALPVLALHGAALTQVGAATALTKCEAGEYVVTRQWARALLNWLPDVAGFRYRSRHDEDLYALVLFEDIPPSGRLRAHGGLAVEAGHSYALDSAAGLSVVRRVLRNHNDALS